MKPFAWKKTLPAIALAVAALAPRTASADETPASTVVVHLAARNKVLLTLHNPSTGEWMPVCESPCDTPLPTGAEYRVLEDDPPRYGEAFVLEPSPHGSVTIEHRPQSTSLKTTGTLLLAVGIPATIIGTSLAIGLAASGPAGNPWGEGLRKMGVGLFAIMGGSGALATTIGAVCLGQGSGHTKALPYREATWVTPSSSAPRLPPTVTPIDIRF